MKEMPDFYNLIARQRGVPEGWHWYSLNVVGDIKDRANGGILVKGAICTAVYKSGPRKGQPNWSKRTDEREFLITTRDYDAAMAAWEAETGNCSRCGGDGQELASASSAGSTYRACRKCNATGRAVPL